MSSTDSNHSDSMETIEIILQPPSLDIMGGNSIQVDFKFVLKFTTESKIFSKEEKDSCKILQILPEYNCEESLALVDNLNPIDYPNLFIFVIEIKNNSHKLQNENDLSYLEKLKIILLKFGKARPLILQLTEDEHTTIFYKVENDFQFVEIDQQKRNFNENKTFPIFLCSLLSDEMEIIKDLNIILEPQVQNSYLIIRFLMIMCVNEDDFENFIFEVAKKGTKEQFFALLDVSFESNGRILNRKAQTLISKVIEDEQKANEVANNQDVDILSNHDDSSSVSSKLSIVEENNEISILRRALENEDEEIVDYLITYCTHLLQQLSFKHQELISRIALESHKFDVLCDLLKISDFPFPRNLISKMDTISHQKLLKIIDERAEFNTSIRKENFEEIDTFIKNNLSLKFVYNINNKSAMSYSFIQAKNTRKFKVFYYLKSFGFQGENCEEILSKLSEKVKKQASKQANEQRKLNVDKSLSNDNKSALQLAMRSLIHNRRIEKSQELECRGKITKWFQNIHVIAPKMIDVAASCEDLKIIFDFESDSVENASLSGADSQGSMYPISKLIFVGAKLTDEKREQQIKGVLAHELCHYVMRMVYENNENPYYENSHMANLFQKIVNIIHQILKDSNFKDECRGIISSVFKLYQPAEYHPELIVRVVQILAEYDGDKNTTTELQKKYMVLFGFWEAHVVVDLFNFDLENRERVRKMNNTFELLTNLKSREIELSFPNDIRKVCENKLIIITTNAPKLLFINIYQYLQQKYGNQLDTQYIFVDLQKLQIIEIHNEFSKLLRENKNLSLVIDYSKGVSPKIINEECNTIMVVSNEDQQLKILEGMSNDRQNIKSVQINYNWSCLSEQSKKTLIQTEINFQNKEFSLMDLFTKDTGSENNDQKSIEDQFDKYLKDFSEILDGSLLNELIEKSKIYINVKHDVHEKCDIHEKKFEFLFKERQFLKKQDNTQFVKITQEDLLSEVKNVQYVLISDKAGNGKSWTMRNFTKLMREKNPTRWITYIELKDHLNDFNKEPTEPIFSTFMLDKILKLKNKFEEKIFKELYEIGKVSILFDGYDEIAPVYTTYVKNLAKSFQFNGGNQLWIATRDFFENDLKKQLQLNVIYKLIEFTEEDGVNLIIAIWVLTDFKNISEIKSRNDFDKYVNKSTNFNKYKIKAEKIVKKVSLSENRSLRFPLLFKMIAEGFKDKDDEDQYKCSIIFETFLQNLYNRWSQEKGQLRFDANIESQKYNMSFRKYHEFSAIKSLFPVLVAVLCSLRGELQWKEEEVIACGIVSKINGEYFFIHKTIRDFLVADAIATALTEVEIIEGIVLEHFIKILTVNEYGTIRMFLNDIIKNYSVLQNYQDNLQSDICSRNTINTIFTNPENLEHLGNYVISVFETVEDNYNYKEILKDSVNNIIFNSKNQKMLLKFLFFLYSYMTPEEIKNLIMTKYMFHNIIESNQEITVFKIIVEKTKELFDGHFIQRALKLTNTGEKGNIFYYLCNCQDLKADKFKQLIEIMQGFITNSEIFNLLKNCNNDKENILQVCIQIGNDKNFEMLWQNVKELFASSSFQRNVKKFIKQKDTLNRTLLHCASLCNKIDNHQVLWDILKKTFENQEELKEFILQCVDENNYIHHLVRKNEILSIVKFTFGIMKAEFKDHQFMNILDSEGNNKMNLLQSAACESKNIEVHEFLWNLFSNAHGAYFERVLMKVDEDGQNILNIAISNSNFEVFKFIISKLENLNMRANIKRMLINLNNNNQNILQSALIKNKSLEFHEFLVKKYKKYFEKPEMIKLIEHVDKDGDNLFFTAVSENSFEVVNLMWKNIKSILSVEDQFIYLTKKDVKGKKLTERVLNNETCTENLHSWIQCTINEYKKQNSYIKNISNKKLVGCVIVAVVTIILFNVKKFF